MKPKHFVTLLALFALSLPQARAQFYSEEPIPAPTGHQTAGNVYRLRSDSVWWIALSDSMLSQVFDTETHRTVFYIGSGSPGSLPATCVILDSTQRTTSVWASTEIDLYNSAVASNPAGTVAVAWSRQRLYASDIIYPLHLARPELQCAVVAPGAPAKILRLQSADHPSSFLSDAGLIHLVFEDVVPFQSSALYNPWDTSYYFVTSQLKYRVLHQNGDLDSIADFAGGFRPQIHIDGAGNSHLFWLGGDSSNTATFSLNYSRNPGSPVATTTMIHPSVPALEEYALNRRPPSYSSFVDDSGRVAAGWTVEPGTLFFGRLLAGNTWQLDTLENQVLSSRPAEFRVDRAGNAHVLWKTYDYSTGWTLHYSWSSPTEHLFVHQRTFQSPYPYGGDPLIIIDSRGIANALFDDGTPGIGYLRNLPAGPDTVFHVSPGSSITPAIQGFPPFSPERHLAALDSTDQIWLFRSNNGVALLRIDRTLTAVEEAAGLPDGFTLHQNFPNPFNPATVLSYHLPTAADVKLAVYDLLGREVRRLVNEVQPPGKHEVKFDATGLASGFYLYRLTAGSFSQSRKMLLLR